MANNDTDRLRSIADATIDAVHRGSINDRFNRQFSLVPHLKAMNTSYYAPENLDLAHWKEPSYPNQPPVLVRVETQKMSALEGIRYIQTIIGRGPHDTVGVLNFASATRPGGGFRSGARAQEESLARSSTLFKSLESDAAKPFYDRHNAPGGDPYYTPAMIYSPHVVFFRDDGGRWLSPTFADVLTCAAVNAKKVRSHPRCGQDPEVERWIEQAMRDRMGRILKLFEDRGARDLVLGSFGTGVFQNDVRMVARIWRDLLCEREARFRFSFNSVVFTIPDSRTLEEFDRELWGSNRNRSKSMTEGHWQHGHGHHDRGGKSRENRRMGRSGEL